MQDFTHFQYIKEYTKPLSMPAQQALKQMTDNRNGDRKGAEEALYATFPKPHPSLPPVNPGPSLP